MDGRPEVIESLLAVLLEEELALADIVGLALEEQAALVRSDFPAIERTSAAMVQAAERLDELDRERLALTDAAGGQELAGAPIAGSSAEGLAEVRSRLVSRAIELRDVQEANARLILDAVRLRERWYGLLAGMTAPTYGAAGRQEVRQRRGMVSKSA